MPAPLAADAPLDVLRRRLADRYAVERELGRGGMGAVYLARDVRLDRPVALKVLPAEYTTQPALRERFLRETRTAASFSHPNIVPVYAVEEWDDLLAYAMGLVEGETLAERVARMGPLPVRELVRVLQDTAYALAYAHGRGVVHRDIKPDNVMIERATGRALVMDFGISRSITPLRRDASGASDAGLTRVGEVVGTPEYMSPEQAAGDHVDGRSDLYALGLTAHFAATGRVAVTGDSTHKILAKQLTEAVPPIASARPELPLALADAIDRCVAKDPADRFPSAEALVEAIDAAQLAEPEIPLPVRLFAGEAATLMGVAAAILLFSVFYLQDGNSRTSGVDVVLPLLVLYGVLVTRVLTTLGEARQLAVAGFDADTVMTGLARVMAERSQRRAELRADPETRRRRRRTIAWGAALLVLAVVMTMIGLSMRVRVGPRRFNTPLPGIVLVMTAAALLGTSFVLLIKSPFRMPPGERFFRRIWLGPLGRAFVRFAGRGVSAGAVAARPRSGAIPMRTPSPMHASTPDASPTVVTRPAPGPPAADLQHPALRALDPLADLEARVAELERWRRQP